MIGLFRRRGDLVPSLNTIHTYTDSLLISTMSLHTPSLLTCVPSVFFGLITYLQFTPGQAQRFQKRYFHYIPGARCDTFLPN